MSRTFSFKALRNPLVSIILTRESFGYKDAETSDGRVRANIDKWGSHILIIEWRGCCYICGSYQTTKSLVQNQLLN